MSSAGIFVQRLFCISEPLPENASVGTGLSFCQNLFSGASRFAAGVEGCGGEPYVSSEDGKAGSGRKYIYAVFGGKAERPAFQGG